MVNYRIFHDEYNEIQKARKYYAKLVETPPEEDSKKPHKIRRYKRIEAVGGIVLEILEEDKSDPVVINLEEKIIKRLKEEQNMERGLSIGNIMTDMRCLRPCTK